ncbi:MAG: DEAD/DEAH box helicase [Acidimicrobiales bacterium]|nr:DEAD/DEAH box helicase [Acidimicrobiales bacterium]
MTEAPFVLDRFQREAIAAIDLGRNVLVAAPTGAGKTVVADHAVDVALAEGRRAFYTTPIKALSNQKYGDLLRRHGPDAVGLMTGDNVRNPDAPIVVMTTEVLRNMIYARSGGLDRLSWVVLDEVHYLQDPYRGPVWEEVIVHAPPTVRFACLSATVSNAAELAGWIEAARGPTDTVVETERPVELVNHYLVYDKVRRDLVQVESLVDGRPNPDGARFDPAGEPSGPRRGGGRGRHRWGAPRRGEVVEHLQGAGLLPAIVFVFSRNGCDEAARSVVAEGVRLTTAEERRRIREIADAHVAHLDAGDLSVLGHDGWRSRLEAGVASHHAGLVPPFKEAVEACFVEGLVKVVFATETLALGINMPARSVVIEQLSKFTGEHHEDLTPSQYTQLTGRAGRRGLDPVGHALVLWSPWHRFDQVAALAASREYVLRSAFRPTYNMVVNLIDRYDRDTAVELLGRSFAQYQADAELARVVHRRAERAARLADATEAATCELGDVDEYRRRRSAQRAAARAARQAGRSEIEAAVGDLAPGEVIRLGGRRLAVLSVSQRAGGARLRLVDPEARVHQLHVDELDAVPLPAGAITLPQPYDPRDRVFQRRAAAALRKARLSDPTARADAGGAGATAPADDPAELAVARCPDLDAHLQAARERDRLRRQVDDLDRRVGEAGSALLGQFEVIERILRRRGMVDDWTLTPGGRILTRVFHESDLLVALAVEEGVFDGLDAPGLAGLVSLVTYEHRSKQAPPPPWYPSKELRRRAGALDALAATLAKEEEKAGLTVTRPPDPTFLALAYAWASGADFDVVVEDEDLSGGDFVRNVKQLIDLLGQLAQVAPVAETRRVAGEAADALRRGVVAASSEVGA